jgi:hypothetical protein
MWHADQSLRRCGTPISPGADVARRSVPAQMWRGDQSLRRCGAAISPCADVARRSVPAQMWPGRVSPAFGCGAVRTAPPDWCRLVLCRSQREKHTGGGGGGGGRGRGRGRVLQRGRATCAHGRRSVRYVVYISPRRPTELPKSQQPPIARAWRSTPSAGREYPRVPTVSTPSTGVPRVPLPECRLPRSESVRRSSDRHVSTHASGPVGRGHPGGLTACA